MVYALRKLRTLADLPGMRLFLSQGRARRGPVDISRHRRHSIVLIPEDQT